MATSRKRTVEIDVVVDDKAASQKLKNVGDSAQKSAKGFSALSGGMQAAFGGAAVAAVGAFAADAVKSFSEVEQSAGSVESVFGESADAIISKAEGAAEAFGLSASEFQTSAALIGSMLKNQMGLSAEEAAEQVDDLTGKAADMAATFGGTTSEAIEAIGSLLRGERDPIERYGVSMNDASISAYALEEGLVASNKQMTPQIKAAAALDILFEQTSDSAGQFARESDTLAGKQQILTAQVENAKAAIGEHLAPAVGLAGDAVEIMIPIVETLTSALGGATEATQPLVDELGTLVGIAPESGVGLESVGTALATTILPFLAPVIGGLANINEVLGTNAEKNEDALRAMEDARTHGVEPLTGAIDDQATAEGNLTDAIGDTMDIRQEAFDQVKGQMDTFWGLVDATEKQAEAQAVVNDLEARGLENTPTYTDAVRTLAETTLDVEDAQMRLLTSGGLTREEFEKQRVKMGLSVSQAQVLIDKYDLIFSPRSVTHRIIYNENRVTGKAGTETNVSGDRHSGGTVPGVPGSEVPIMARAGEFVSQGGRDPHGNGAGPMVVQVNVDGKRFIEELVVPQLARYSRRNGGLGF